MDHYYVACDFGPDSGGVKLGTLHQDRLALSEIRRFANTPVTEKSSVHWNITGLYQELMSAFRDLGKYDEPVDSISCTAWGADYLLFAPDGSLITPAYHPTDPRTAEGFDAVLARIPIEAIYAETGVQGMPAGTLAQLAAEKRKRLAKAGVLLPIADGFNYLLSGVARAELSAAATTQLFNPATRAWSPSLTEVLELPPKLLPQVVPAGTRLGSLREAIVKETRLQDAEIVASCSHELAAKLAGLPVEGKETWAFLQLGPWAQAGTELTEPLNNEVSRQMQFTHHLGCGGAVTFSRYLPGLQILSECRTVWKAQDRELDGEVLGHLATSCEPFESLINPSDPRFLEPGDMPHKVQAFCRETGQPIPRKPGPTIRCILESLALQYRKTLREIELLTGREFTRVFLLGDTSNILLNHFIANALQIPVTVATADAAAIGNIVVQAVALGHVPSLAAARDLVRRSIKMETISPHPGVWNPAFQRFVDYSIPGRTPAPTEEVADAVPA
jgi:rhamnulokinase